MEKRSRVQYAVASFFAVVIFVIIYKYSLNMLSGPGLNDLVEHTWHAEGIYLDKLWKSWLQRPYLFWHLCVKGFIKFFKFPTNEASACTNACFAAFCYFVTFFIINRVSGKLSEKDNGVIAALTAAPLSLVTALYIKWFNPYHHEGQFSINPFFNPTHMAVKGFGLLAFAFAIDLVLQYKGKDTFFVVGEKLKKYTYVLFGIALFFSTFTKPTFMYMLLPTGGIYLLIDLFTHLWKKDGEWKKTLLFMGKLLCACLPSLIYLGIEYSAFYLWGGTNADAEIAIYPFLTAWRVYSPDVSTSIIMAMAFPFWMVLTNLKYFFSSVEGRISALAYVVGATEFAFFVETGEKLTHLNFSWPLMSGMLLLWVISAAKLAELTRSSKEGIYHTIVVSGGWILLSIHLFSGLYYLNPYAYII